MPAKKILLIDDSEVVLEATADLLTQAGYSVKTILYPGGAGGILAFQLAEFQPDLILCDVDMPYLKGDAIAQTLKSNPHFKPIKICLYSSKPMPELAACAKASGADDFMNKTNDGKLLIKKIREMVGA